MVRIGEGEAKKVWSRARDCDRRQIRRFECEPEWYSNRDSRPAKDWRQGCVLTLLREAHPSLLDSVIRFGNVFAFESDPQACRRQYLRSSGHRENNWGSVEREELPFVAFTRNLALTSRTAVAGQKKYAS